MRSGRDRAAASVRRGIAVLGTRTGRHRTRTRTRRSTGPKKNRRRSDRTSPESQSESGVSAGETLGPASPAAALVGCVIAMIVVGLNAHFAVIFASTPASNAPVGGAVVGAATLALAVGVRVPQRVAVWLFAHVYCRVVAHAGPIDPPDGAMDPVEPDRTLYWTVLSMIALAAGVLTAVLPLSIRLTTVFYEWMLAHFLWPVGPLALLQATVVLFTGLAPLMVLGVAVSCVHHLSCPHGGWETRATAWLLIGAGCGASIAAIVLRSVAQTDLLLIAAALPALVLSVLAALWHPQRDRATSERSDSAVIPLPTSSERRPRLVRTGLVAAGGSGACVMSVWLAHCESAFGGSTSLPVWLLLAMGAGGLAGCWHSRTASRSIGGFGLASVVAGLAVGLGAVALGGGMLAGALASGIVACAGMAAIGVATTYGRQALLRRVASRSSTGAIVLTRTLICIALTAWVISPVSLLLAGPVKTLMIPAFALVTLGAWLMFREPIGNG